MALPVDAPNLLAAKLDHLSLVRVAPLEAIDMLITNAAPSGALTGALAAANVEIRVAKASALTS